MGNPRSNRRSQSAAAADDSGNYGDLPDQAPRRRPEPPPVAQRERVQRGAHPDAEYNEDQSQSSNALIMAENGHDGNNELATSGQRSAALAEIQACVIMAKRFPRNEDDAHGLLMKSCLRRSFQEVARYNYPRGKREDGSQNYVSGPSVHLAREGARCWKNIRYGFYVVYDDEKRCQLRGYAWDLETMEKVEQDAAFAKLIFRKGKGWIKPDERELRELINKHGAIAERNCILKILPPWLIEDAEEACVTNLHDKIVDDLENQKRDIVAAFARFNVLASMIEDWLGHSMTEITAAEIVELRGMYASIRDGQSRWSEYLDKPEPEGADTGSTAGKATGPNKVTAEDLLRKAEPKPPAGQGTPPTSAAPAAEQERQRQISGDAPTRKVESPELGKTTEVVRDPTPPKAESPEEHPLKTVPFADWVGKSRPARYADRLDWYRTSIAGVPDAFLGLLSDEITADRSLTDEDVNLLDELIEVRRGG